MSDLNTEVQLLKKEVSDMKMIYSRLDKAIEKISDVSNSINRMLAVHEEKISQQEESQIRTEQEINILSELQTQQNNRYKEDIEAAKAFNQTGIKLPPVNIDPTELASWTSVARTILNLHETITRH